MSFFRESSKEPRLMNGDTATFQLPRNTSAENIICAMGMQGIGAKQRDDGRTAIFQLGEGEIAVLQRDGKVEARSHLRYLTVALERLQGATA